MPGHSIETFPKQMKMVADAGHEIGLHGYSHENPIAMTPEQEEAVLVKTIDLVEKLSGRRPVGYVAPWWELSPNTIGLLQKYGIKYDHSRMDNDFHPFYARVGDTWTKIDYSKPAEEWMKPLIRGEETDIVEIPANWYLDDLPPMMFIKKAPNSHGFVNPAISSRCGWTNLTGCIVSTTTRSFRLRSIPMSVDARKYSLCLNVSSATSAPTLA
ncbi:polysaccharide deacetylase family protein [Thermomicrobium sp. 4228-Ro]|nr:polysaccharide deacetylase family protein [Thermomicrobium sp. 4228-Ro]